MFKKIGKTYWKSTQFSIFDFSVFRSRVNNKITICCLMLSLTHVCKSATPYSEKHFHKLYLMNLFYKLMQ